MESVGKLLLIHRKSNSFKNFFLKKICVAFIVCSSFFIGSALSAFSATTTLTTGSDLTDVIIGPGSTATSVSAFTFQTDTGTDVITAVTLNVSNASATSKIEITNDSGTIVYGSSTNPTGATTTSITLNTNTLTANTSLTQYKIRITPKAQSALAATTTWAMYPVTTSVRSWTSSNTATGTDTVTSSVVIDNEPPSISGQAGLLWASSTTVGSATWRSLVYGNGKFVSLSASGLAVSAMYSTNGVTWIPGTGVGTSTAYASIAYGNGRFVAITSGSTTAISTDGVTWATTTGYGGGNTWNAITYGNGQFLAVATVCPTLACVKTSPDGITWTSRTVPASSGWTSVVYGGGRFVAVAGSATDQIMYSTDGITWATSSPSFNGWNEVTYGNGMYVVVDGNVASKQIMTSPDAVTWTQRYALAGVTNQWRGLTYANGMFVAVAQTGSENRIMTSPDGITWTARKSGNNTWLSVAYGNSRFVSVADTADRSMISTSSLPTVAPGHNKATVSYITPGETDLSSVVILRSTSAITDVPVDGTTYTGGEVIGGSTVACVDSSVATSTLDSCIATGLTNGTAYHLKVFMKDLYGNYSAGIAASSSPVTPATTTTLGTGTDLATVTISPASTTASVNAFTFQTDNGTDAITAITLNVANASATSLIEITSDDNTIVYGSSTNPVGATTTTIALGFTLTANTTLTQYKIRITPKAHNVLATSSMGMVYPVTASVLSWTGTNTNKQGTDTATTSVIIDNQPPPLIGGGMATSWATTTVPQDNSWQSVTYGNGLFVAVSYTGTGNRVMTSPDGITWTSRTSASNNNWTGVAYGNGIFVAVSASSTSAQNVMTSPDGTTWTLRTGANRNSWYAVTFGNGLFVAVAYTGFSDRVMTSPDGITWTARVSAADNTWNSVTYGNGTFVAVSDNSLGTVSNRVMTSPDGITWTARSSSDSTATGYAWQTVTYGNGLFVAVGTTAGVGNHIMTSPDGITWTARTAPVDNNWYSVAYGNGRFVAGASTGSGDRVMTSIDGITWATSTTADNAWRSLVYGSSTFVAVGDTAGVTKKVMRSSTSTYPTVTAGDTSDVISYTVPGDSDINSIVVLRSTSGVITDTPVEGVFYSAGDAVGASSTVACVDGSLTPLTSDFCNATGLTNGTSYHFKIFTVDNYGNYSVGVVPTGSPTIATSTGNTKVIVTLDDGVDGSSLTLGPGFSATNTNSFTLRTSTTTSSITSVTVNLNAGGANNGITWATSSTVAMNNSWLSVAYGDGMFVAISASTTNNSVMTSPDGITWTLRTATSTNGWQSVTYGAGLFVAVADSGAGYRVMTSATGTVWTSASSTTPNNIWKSVTYGNGLFVAVAATSTTNNVMTSTDGIVWTSRTGATSNQWSSVTYGNGLFVAVATSGTGNRVMTSPNGITWTSRTSATNNRWTSVSYGAGLYVAVSSTSTASNIMTSPDGITWTQRSSSNFNSSSTISYGNGLFVIVSATTSTANVVTSPDGITWTIRTSPVTNQWKGVVYGNGVFVTVGQTGAGNRAMRSTSGTDPQTVIGRNNGVTWVRSGTGNIYQAYSSVAYGNGLFVAVSQGAQILTSPDGITWTSRQVAIDNQWRAITYGNGLFVAVANAVSSGTSGAVMTSPDGITWTSRSASSANDWYLITYGNGLFVAVSSTATGTISNRVMTSPDGITWTSRTAASDNSWSSIVYGNGIFVAVSTNATGTISNRVMTSPDGINWTSRTAATNELWSSVTYGNGLYVAVAGMGLPDGIMTSPDGITWTTRQISTPATEWSTVAYGNGLFVALSTSCPATDCAMISSDGISWSTTTTPYDESPEEWRSLVYGNGKFVAVSGLSDNMMSSNSGTYYNNSEYYKGVALVEITNDAGGTVYGSVANPTSDQITIPLTNTITAFNTNTQYRVRITPKSQLDMPSPELGSTYPIKAKVTSLITSTGIVEGTDAAGATTTIDNLVVGTKFNGTSWTQRTTLLYLNEVSYGNGLFVAIGGNLNGINDVATSPDGINWTIRSTGVADTWSSIAYGNGTFVALSCGTTGCGGPGNYTLRSTDGITWATSTSPANNFWTSVSYGNGLFVAVSDQCCGGSTNDRVMTSPDGITWTARTAANNYGWSSVTYGNGLFVAVANNSGDNAVMTSPDGINWTARTAISGGSNQWSAVTYGNGLFVAVDSTAAISNAVMTSPDGINWTLRTTPIIPTSGLISVIYANNLFVAGVNGADNIIMTSSDGITWATSTSNNGVNHFAYTSGILIGVTNSGIESTSAYSASAYSNRVSLTFTTPSDSDLSSILVLKSTDITGDTPLEGTTYATSSRIGSSDVVCAFAVATSTSYTCNSTFNTYNGTPYYFKLFTRDIYGNYSSQVPTSSTTPGRSITLGTGTEASSTIILAPGGTATTSNVFTLQTDTGTDIVTSVDVSFTSGTATSTSLIEITNNAGTVVYGSVSTSTSDTVSIPLTTTILTATSGPTQYKVRITPKSHVDMPGPTVGSTYIINSYVSNFVGTNITNENGSDTSSTTVVIDNDSPSEIRRSGYDWQTRTNSVNDTWADVAYGNGLFVAVHLGSCSAAVCAMSSPDGITWTARSAYNEWSSVIFANNLFVAVGGGTQKIMTSSNGTVWTSRTPSDDVGLSGVTYGEGLYVAVGYGTTTSSVMTSPDGIAWTRRTTPVSSLSSVAYGAGVFVATINSSANTILLSTDGVNWNQYTLDFLVASGIGVEYINNYFIISTTDVKAKFSSDGYNWENEAGSAATGHFIAFGDGKYVSVRSGSFYTIDIKSVNDSNGFVQASYPGVAGCGITYGNGTFVVVQCSGGGNESFTSSGPSATSSSGQVVITFTSPSDSDLSTTTILRSTSAITDTPVEGISYATGTTIGASTAACSFRVTASSTRTCTVTGLTNGTPYYFKILTQDVTGNWSEGVALDPIIPGSGTVTLASGNDPIGGNVAPGGSATTSNTFTFQASSGTDVIGTTTLTFASSTAQALSLVEITNDAGTTVFGSVANPSSDIVTIPLTSSILTATSGITQYRVRITPKTHTNMPSVPRVYGVTSYVSSFSGTSYAKVGTDNGATTTVISIDNNSPSDINSLGSDFTIASGTQTIKLWNDVTYGNGLFVAVSATPGVSNQVVTSPDGINWTARNSAADNEWTSVTYGGGKFVAVAQTGTGNRVMYSTNGTSWITATSTTDKSWFAVKYTNGRFVAISGDSSGNDSITSTDGMTWTLGTGSFSSEYSLEAGNGFFVVGYDFGGAYVSTDGSTWSSLSSLDLFMPRLFFNGYRFYIDGGNGNGYYSVDGTNWTRYSSGLTFGDGCQLTVALDSYFYCLVDNTRNYTLFSYDGITWETRSTNQPYTTWSGVAYSTSTMVAVASGTIMYSFSPVVNPASSQLSITFTNPPDSDLSTTTILRSTSAITDTPVEGISYATGTTIGASTATCSFRVTASSTRTCTVTGLTNGTPYYFKILTQDVTGNWSEGVQIGPYAPGATTVTLGVGTDTPSVSISPGGSATTSDTFTLQTSAGTDIVTSATVTFASGTAQSLSLVEITNNAGSTVYGSTANPSSDSVLVTLSTNTLTANTTLTQYRVRITPKTGSNMPASPGDTYYVTSYISSFTGTNAATLGSDLGGGTSTVVTIDNLSPSAPTVGSGVVTNSKQILLSYTNSTTTDATSTIVLRATSAVTDSPVEGSTYTAGNTIGSATVICVSDIIILGGDASCLDVTAVRSTNYYYKVFTKDISGNYSAGFAITGSPFNIQSPRASSAAYVESEIQTTATTTQSGGGSGSGGDSGEGGGSGATTTQSGGGQGGGGSGDSGNLYKPSNLASLFRNAFSGFFTSAVTGNSGKVTAQTQVPESSAPTQNTCSLKVFGVCIVSSSP